MKVMKRRILSPWTEGGMINNKFKIFSTCFGLILTLAHLSFLFSQERIANIRYEIRVELDDQNKMLHGKENISWLNRTRDEVRDMWFHLYWNAFKNENSTMNQEAREESLAPLRLDGFEIKDGDWGWVDIKDIRLADGTDLRPSLAFVSADEPVHPGDQTVAKVELPRPVKSGEEVQLQIVFQSKIPKDVLRTGYYKHSYFISQWFPKPGVYEERKGWNCHEYHLNSEFFADFADFAVQITVPEKFVVGASGKQIEAVPDAAKKTVTYTFEQRAIHDFAWTADPNFIKVERDFIGANEVTPQEYEEISRALQLPQEETRLGNVRMILLIAPEHKGQIDRHFAALRAAIKYYGLWYGPYPYETVTMVDPPFRTGSGGMEYPTLFTAGTSILKSKDVLSPEGVIIHEFGHGYWYGLCASNEFEEAWLDEGINTYSTGKVVAKAYGIGASSMSFNRIPLAWFFKFPRYYDRELDRAAAIQAVEYDPVTTASWKFLNRGSYGLNVYMRASTCLNTLEKLVGEETMLRIMRTFHQRFRYKHPKTQDFWAVVNEVTGRDMTWFFQELFASTLNFDYGVSILNSSKKVDQVRGVFEIEGKKKEFSQKEVRNLEKGRKKSGKKEKYITTVVLRRFGEAKVDKDTGLKIKVVFEDGSEEILSWDGQDRWKRLTFEKAARARYAQIDPDGIWLIDSNLANNSLKREPSRGGVLKFVSRLLFYIQNFFQSISGLS